jgi:hypothetical protein
MGFTKFKVAIDRPAYAKSLPCLRKDIRAFRRHRRFPTYSLGGKVIQSGEILVSGLRRMRADFSFAGPGKSRP